MLHVVPPLDDAVLHGVGYLEHGAGGGGLVATHDVLDDDVIIAAPLFGSQDRAADDGRELVLGEVLRGVADFQEAGAPIEDWSSFMLDRSASMACERKRAHMRHQNTESLGERCYQPIGGAVMAAYLSRAYYRSAKMTTARPRGSNEVVLGHQESGWETT